MRARTGLAWLHNVSVALVESSVLGYELGLDEDSIQSSAALAALLLVFNPALCRVQGGLF